MTVNRHDKNLIEVLNMPSMGLPYFDLLVKNLERHNVQIRVSQKFPTRKIFFDHKFDAIHLHMLEIIFRSNTRLSTSIKNVWFKYAIIPTIKIRGIRLVWTCHEIFAHENDPGKIAFKMAKVIGRHADAIIVHNVHMKIRLAELVPATQGKIVVVPHGDLAPYYQELVTVGGQISDRADIVFASIGYMRRNKGNDIILRAFSRLGQKNVRLVMTGNCNDPVYQEELMHLASRDDRITLDIRTLSTAEIVAEHEQASAIVFAFRDCPTSGSLVTAMSLGRAVIGPAIGHLPEVVDQTNGWLFAEADGETGLLSSMEKAIANKGHLQKFGMAAKARMARDDWASIAETLVALYRGMANNACAVTLGVGS